MEALKSPKEPRCSGAVETRAVVANEIDAASIVICLSKLDTSGFALCGEFPRVLQEIFQCDPHQVRVRVCFQSFLNVELSSPSRLAILQFSGNSASHRAQVNPLHFHS